MTFRIARKETDPNYGMGTHTIDEDDESLVDGEELIGRLLERFHAPGYEPPMVPAVAMDLMELSRSPDVEVSAIVKLLEKEPMLAARVLKLVQSPAYASATATSTLKDAIVRLGLATLRDVVWEVVMNMRIFRVDGYTEAMEFLRRHCTFTAHLARIVAKYTSVEGEYAFLCGLLHDVGVAGTLIALADVSKKEKPPHLVALWPAIARAHEEAGQNLVKLWKLPPDIQWVVGAHHSINVGGMPHPLAATVCLAEHIANEFGVSMMPPKDLKRRARSLANQLELPIDTTHPKLVVKACQVLGVNKQMLNLVRKEAAQAAASVTG